MRSRLLNKTLSLIQYASDLHIENGFPRKLIAKRPYLILNGDIGLPFEPSYKNYLLNISNDFEKVFVISGNHEYDIMKNNDKVTFEMIDEKIENICKMRNNLFYAQKKQFVLDEKDSIDLVGCTMWSALPKSKQHLHEDHKKFLLKTLENQKNRNFVFATHHCPSYYCIDKKYPNRTRDYFVSNNNILEKKNDNLILWIYGHSHKNQTFFINNTLLSSNQYGYGFHPLNGFWH